jgi:signal transduction histidine kinase
MAAIVSWRLSPVVALAVCGAGFVLAVWALVLSINAMPHPWWVLVPSESVGLVFLGVGLYGWLRRPQARRMVWLVVAVGATWYLGDLQLSSNPVLFRLGFWRYYLNVVVLAHLLLAYPDGRLTRPVERLTIVAQYVAMLVTQGMRVLTERPLQPQGWGDPHATISVWAPVGSVLSVLLTIAMLVLVGLRWRAEPPPVRRARGLFWASVAVIGLVIAWGSVAALLRASVTIQGTVLLLYALAHLLLGVALLTGPLHTQMTSHRHVTGLLAQLHGQPVDHVRLHHILAEALEDPRLTLHYRRADSDDYVDAYGLPAPPPTRTDRATTVVRGRDQRPLAVLSHDPVLAEMPQYRRRLQAVVAAAALAIENARLQAENRAHLRGLLEVEQATRRTIRAMLHDGPQHRLSALQLLLGQLRKRHDSAELDADLRQIAAGLQATVHDLREVTQGIYPSNLRLSGLDAALDSLAQRSPIPLVLDVSSGRWASDVEETAFFIISEAVGNVHKHANATRITVRVHGTAQHLAIEVCDDGSGSAGPTATGTGLRGLRDRVAAHAGTLAIDSPPGGGTRIQVMLPCA